ncbi:hypothetical protein FQZ97_844790 [compost metagenome]
MLSMWASTSADCQFMLATVTLPQAWATAASGAAAAAGAASSFLPQALRARTVERTASERWGVWDMVFSGFRVVVSTDALRHWMRCTSNNLKKTNAAANEVTSRSTNRALD